MITIPKLLRLLIPYQFYFVPIRLYCPICRLETNHKAKTYHSLKSLSTHLALNHKEANGIYPFSVSQVREIMKILAKAIEWRILA